MNKKLNSLFKIGLLTIAFFSVIGLNCCKAGFLGDMSKAIADFQNQGKNSTENVNITNVVGELVSVGQALTFIGTGVLVGVTAFMGIKFLTSGPQEQAKIKEQLLGLLVAGFVIFGAYFIWKAIIDIVSII